jgi:O-antigen ligase
LIEYWAALQHIARAPFFGHRFGFMLQVRESIFGTVTSQWYVHQTYLWIWLKLGIVGLAALVATLWVAVREGTRSARANTGEPSAWSAAAAAAALHMAVVGLTNFSLAQVNGTVLMAFLWGIALSSNRLEGFRVVWRAEDSSAASAG